MKLWCFVYRYLQWVERGGWADTILKYKNIVYFGFGITQCDDNGIFIIADKAQTCVEVSETEDDCELYNSSLIFSFSNVSIWQSPSSLYGLLQKVSPFLRHTTLNLCESTKSSLRHFPQEMPALFTWILVLHLTPVEPLFEGVGGINRNCETSLGFILVFLKVMNLLKYRGLLWSMKNVSAGVYYNFC